MLEVFNKIGHDELQTLKDALPLIAILIGKSDDVLDHKEMEIAKKITHIRTFNSPEHLQGFYEQVENEFEGTLTSYLDKLPAGADHRNKEISDRLAKLNPILASLDPKVAFQLYQGFTRFAQEMAKASGGFLGFLSVNKAEAKWVSLPMITPVANTEEEE